VIALQQGDTVWIDSAPLIASPISTGTTVMCEVIFDSPENENQVYLVPKGYSPLYVFKRWITEPASFKTGKDKV
jgi:hypothetical protein